MLRAKQVDGLIVFPTGENVRVYEEIVNERFPLVFVDRTVEGLNVDSFLLDNEKASSLAVNHFIDKGHWNIGIITTSLARKVTPRVERIEGYKKTLKINGIEPREEYIKSLELCEIKNGLKEMMALRDPPTAVLAGNDLVLMEILNFTKENNLRIPDDLAVIGIDDVSFSNIFDPPLTTISHPTFEMGKKAAQLLLKKIEGKEYREGKIHRFNPTLNIRHSC